MPYYFRNPLDFLRSRRPARQRCDSIASAHRRIQERIPKVKVNIAPSLCSHSDSVMSFASEKSYTATPPTTPFSMLDYPVSPLSTEISAQLSPTALATPESPPPPPRTFEPPPAFTFAKRIAEEAIAGALKKRIIPTCILGYREHWQHINAIQVKLMALYPDLATIYTPTRLHASTPDWDFAFTSGQWNLVLLVPLPESSSSYTSPSSPAPSISASRSSLRASFRSPFSSRSRLYRSKPSSSTPNLRSPVVDKFPTGCSLPAAKPYLAHAACIQTGPAADECEWEEVHRRPSMQLRERKARLEQARREHIYKCRARQIKEEDRSAGLGKFASRRVLAGSDTGETETEVETTSADQHTGAQEDTTPATDENKTAPPLVEAQQDASRATDENTLAIQLADAQNTTQEINHKSKVIYQLASQLADEQNITHQPQNNVVQRPVPVRKDSASTVRSCGTEALLVERDEDYENGLGFSMWIQRQLSCIAISVL